MAIGQLSSLYSFIMTESNLPVDIITVVQKKKILDFLSCFLSMDPFHFGW